MPAPAIQTIPSSSRGAQCGVRWWQPLSQVGHFCSVNALYVFLASYHVSASILVEMIWKGKGAQSEMPCFSNLPVSRAHSSCALQRHSGLVKFPAISSCLQHCIQSKHCHQAKWAVSRIPSFPCSLAPCIGRKNNPSHKGRKRRRLNRGKMPCPAWWRKPMQRRSGTRNVWRCHF